jgi:hypothetical protein
VNATRLLRAGVVGVGLLGACGGSGDGDPDAVQGDPTIQVGAFAVELVAPKPANGTTPASDGYTSLLGVVYDAPQPSPIAWAEQAVGGDCTLLVPDPPFCTTPCGTGAVCIAADTCQAYATKQTIGTVHATGLATAGGGAAFDLSEINHNYQVPADVDLAYPAFDAADTIELVAEGSDFTAAFTLTAPGIAELALDPTAIELARDTALPLTWTAGANADARVLVLLDISHHGGSKGKIECTTADDGGLEIGAELMTGLLDLGAAGFPTIIVTRELTTSTVIGAGRVDLIVTSEVERAVTVPGVESCTDDTDCTEPETCQDDLTCG